MTKEQSKNYEFIIKHTVHCLKFSNDNITIAIATSL